VPRVKQLDDLVLSRDDVIFAINSGRRILPSVELWLINPSGLYLYQPRTTPQLNSNLNYILTQNRPNNLNPAPYTHRSLCICIIFMHMHKLYAVRNRK